MKRKDLWVWGMAVMVLALGIFLAGCADTSKDEDIDVDKNAPFVFTGTYNLIKVPVPEGGISFPIGVEDDDTASVEKAFFIGETTITYALWDTVSRWAVTGKKGQRYAGFIYDHDYKDFYDVTTYTPLEPDAPITQYFAEGNNAYGWRMGIHPFYAIPIWCNALTEWYNEKYGTNFTPVYLDSIYPIRTINNYTNYFEKEDPNATGFRVPSAKEWELAARWNGNSNTNSVTKIINSIDFSNQSIKFTKGNSASGAKDSVANYNENSKVAIWRFNAGLSQKPFIVKTKQPNALGLYDMSGNVYEYTSSIYSSIFKSILIQVKGGFFDSDNNDLSVGKNFEMDNTPNYVSNSPYTGFRVARRAE